MRFAYYYPGRQVPADPEFARARHLVGLARAAEEAGFDAVALDEHPIPGSRWRDAPGGHDAIDPFVGLAAVAAGTTTIRLLTYAAVLPYRNPFLLAKAAATLDVVSDGRLILGVAAGYLRSEFRALGVDYDRRNALFDEALDVMKRAWTGDPVHYEGATFAAHGNVAHPPPHQRPHPPIWIGGNGPRTRRRVALHADGWMSLPNPSTTATAAAAPAPALETTDDLRTLIHGLRAEAESVGRTTPLDVIHSLRDAPTDPAALRDLLTELHAIGVTWVTWNGPGLTPTEAANAVRRFGAEVIAPYRALLQAQTGH